MTTKSICAKLLGAVFTGVFAMTLISSTYGQAKGGRLDSLFSARHKQGMFNGNVLVAENNRIVYQQAFGVADIERKVPNHLLSRSELASTSKLFTAVAVLQLYEKGLLRLDDPVVKYLSDFPYPNISIRHLLTHTSGLPDFQIFDSYYQQDPHRILTNRDVIPAIVRYGKLLFNPGDRWSYSSPGMALLADIVVKISGQGFEQYLKKHIWIPAGMHHTYINSISAPVRDNLRVIGYSTSAFFSSDLQRTDTMSRHKQFSHVSGAILGPGLVVSDARDLLFFDQALYTGKVLNAATLEQAFTPIRLSGGEFAHPEPWLGETFFGLGWFILQNPSGKIVLHTGKHAGIVTIFMRNLTRHQTLVMLDNTESLGLNNTALNAFNILNGKPISVFKKSLAKMYVNNLYKSGADPALCNFNALKADTGSFYMDPQEMVYGGLQFMENGHQKEGLETLRLVTVLDPQNSLPYYAYGLGLKMAGKTPEAIMMYQKALAINPGDKAASDALKQMPVAGN
jgi:CubicO group peptidase (beta-lactamase class C family)